MSDGTSASGRSWGKTTNLPFQLGENDQKPGNKGHSGAFLPRDVGTEELFDPTNGCFLLNHEKWGSRFRNREMVGV